MGSVEAIGPSLLLATLAEALQRRGWRVKSQTGDGVLLSEWHSARGARTVAWVTARANRDRREELVVVVADDAHACAPQTWSTIEQITALASTAGATKKGAVLHARFGRDLVFHGLVEGLARGLCAPVSAGEIDGHAIFVDRDRICWRDADLAQVFTAGGDASDVGGRGLLVLTNTDADAERAVALKSASLGAALGDDAAPFVLPVVIGGDRIKARTFAGSLWMSFRDLTGIAASEGFVVQLLRLGYIHLMVLRAHRLAVEPLLDPNTSYVADILGATSGHARLYLFSRRRHALYPGWVRPKGELPLNDPWRFGAFRALAERFVLDRRFAVVDFGQGAAYADWEQAQADALERVARTISDFSGGRLSNVEAEAVLTRLAAQWGEGGEALTIADIRNAVRADARNERVRPENVAFTAAAIAASGALRFPPGEQWLTFSDEEMVLFLLGRDLCRVILEFDISRNTPAGGSYGTAFAETFGAARYSEDVLSVAAEMLWRRSIDAVPEVLRRLVRFSRLDDPEAPDRDRVVQANVLDLLVAAADCAPAYAAQRADVLDRAIVSELHLDSMTLPQFCFRDMSLRKWRFIDCNLRRAVFSGCELNGAHLRESNLSGSAMLDCVFNEFMSFANSNLNGCWVENVRGLSAALTNNDDRRFSQSLSTWIAANIADAMDKDEAIRMRETMRRSGAYVDGLTFRAEDDSGGEGVRRSLPADVWRAALASGVHGARHLVDVDGQICLRRNEIYAGAEGAVVTSVLGSRPGGAGWINFALSDGVLHVEVDGVLHPVVDAGADALSAYSGRDAAREVFWAGIASRQGRVVRLFRVDVSSSTPDVEVVGTWHVDAPPSCLLVAHASPGAPYLVVGDVEGGLSVVGDGLITRRVLGAARTPVDALAFLGGAHVLVRAHRGGMVVGARLMLDAGGEFRLEELFRFQSAVAGPVDIVVPPTGNQFLLIGAPGGEGLPLCVLFSPGGEVAAVFPRPAPSDVAPDDDFVGVTLPAVRAAAVPFDDRLDQYQPVTPNLTFNPNSEDAVEVHLQGRLASPPLWPTVQLKDGETWFREVTLTCVTGGVETRLPECDLTVQPEGQRLTVRARLAFPPHAETSQLTLRIAYRRIGMPVVERNYPFGVLLTRQDNPYDSSGRPVVRRDFWARKDLAEACVRRLADGDHVVLRGARRMGKSSLLRHVATRLREERKLAVAISLLGLTKVARGLARAIADELENASLGGVGKAMAARVSAHAGEANIGPLLSTLAELPEAYGFAPPFVLLVDEWGVTSNRANEATTYDISVAVYFGEEMYAARKDDGTRGGRLAFCLSGTPADFRHAELPAQSDPYRAGMEWCDLGPVKSDEMAYLLSGEGMLKGGQAFVLQDDEAACLSKLYEWSSGDPFAAVLLMRYAFEHAARGRRDKTGAIVIKPDDIAQPDAVEVLRQHYALHRATTSALLSPAALARLAAAAAKAPPPWEARDGIAIPADGAPDPDEWRVFDAAGFRTPIGAGGREGRFRTWIPRGMALDIVTFAGVAQ